ncbi:hypothetical protein K4K55_009219 [Colletotrichum sp. SAR 10_96]|nr:hypothetical protein K4K55_009219 [Colletotrichum sp. SAR 10_96]
MPFSSPEFGLGGICHAAMDFDPSLSLEELDRYQLEWDAISSFQQRPQEEQMDFLRWEMYDSLVQATRDLCYFTTPTLWLVDHRLRRKSTVLDEHMTEMVYGRYGSWPKEQLVFHTAGCRYYAMPEYYARELCGYNAEDEAEGDTDAFGFVYELAELGARQEAFERRGEDEGSGVDEDYYVASVRLLVCERD